VKLPHGRIVVRRRSKDDLDACESLARTVHAVDGYPAFIRDDDFARFVATPDALTALVCELDNRIVGHVALRPTTSPPAMALAASSLGVEPVQLGAIARLMVAPSARRLGIAQVLLETAADSARERGLVPILDVVTRHDAAVSLYETSGWRRLGTVDFALPDGTILEEFVYAAPR
jgi:ribosomal protein S18 acetylase RimI-like enzyme